MNNTTRLEQPWLRLLLLGLFSAGCQEAPDHRQTAGAPPALDESTVVAAEAVMVAKVDTKDGGYVAWYEPVPGLVVVGETGKYPNPPVIRQLREGGIDGSPENLFRKLAPNAPLPKSLTMALERRDQYLSLSESLGLSAAASVRTSQQPSETSEIAVASQAVQDPIADDSACPWSWFAPNQCFCWGEWCEQLGYQTGTTSFTRHDQNSFRSAACVYRGTIRYVTSYKTWWSWSTAVNAVVSAGWYSTWWRDNVSIDFDASSWVKEAEGDGYHHCGDGWGDMI